MPTDVFPSLTTRCLTLFCNITFAAASADKLGSIVTSGEDINTIYLELFANAVMNANPLAISRSYNAHMFIMINNYQ